MRKRKFLSLAIVMLLTILLVNHSKKKCIIMSVSGVLILGLAVLLIGIISVWNYKFKDTYPLADWAEYGSIEVLVGNADYVFEGTINTIEFESIDQRTGKIMNYTTDGNHSVELYTLYNIKVEKMYKGEKLPSNIIKAWGGIEGYKEFEQRYVLMKSGIPYRTILKDRPLLKEGEKCIFVTSQGMTDYLLIISPRQFAYSESNMDSGINYASIKAYFQK